MDSYPPHLLRLPGSAPGSPARGCPVPAQAAAPVLETVQPGGQQEASQLLLATPGTPGRYEPAVSSSDRPRNITELRQRVQPATPEPWPAGAYILVSTTGRRAHWNGTDWKLKESPGYGAETATVRSEPEQYGAQL